jgi:hypothetical protein
MQTPQLNPSKYKTMLCKHFLNPKGCSFGDKCQFAHGINELRSDIENPNIINNEKKKNPNPLNYKIVKCKYWEKDNTCRYGTLCTFAHGNSELRSKNDNIVITQNEQFGNFNNFGFGNLNFDNNLINNNFNNFGTGNFFNPFFNGYQINNEDLLNNGNVNLANNNFGNLNNENFDYLNQRFFGNQIYGNNEEMEQKDN